MVQALHNTIFVLLIVFMLGCLMDIICNTITKVLLRLFGYSVANFIMNRLTFIGVIHHELSHALFALITGAKVTKINIFKPNKNSGTLGSVNIVTRGNSIIKSFQLTASAIAPMITGIFTINLLLNISSANGLKLYLILIIYYLIFSIISHMRMSKQDIKNALKGIPLVSLTIFIIIWLFNIDLISYIMNM